MRDVLIRVRFVPTVLSQAIAAGLLALTAIGLLNAQEKPSAAAASSASVTFTLDFPESNPQHYSITVDATGHTRFECIGKVAQESDTESYAAEFEMSDASRQQIFAWTKQAHFFAGNIDSGNTKLANTGGKILSYQDGQHSATARYNYSNLAPVRQLTALFQNIAATEDYGRRLAYYHRYQKLALDDELKRMEGAARNNELSEIQSVAPVLQEILDDATVINGVRARAKELIRLGTSATARR